MKALFLELAIFRANLPSQLWLRGFVLAVGLRIGLGSFAFGEELMVDSLAEFAALAKKDDQTITLVAGDYELGDFLTPEVIKRKRRRKGRTKRQVT